MSKIVRIAWRQVRSRIYGDEPKYEAELRELVGREWKPRGRVRRHARRDDAVFAARELAKHRFYEVDDKPLRWDQLEEPTQAEIDELVADFADKFTPVPPAPYRLCRCPIGVQLGDCPFGYANGWHNQRAEMLMRTAIDDPELIASINHERAKHAPEELDQL